MGAEGSDAEVFAAGGVVWRKVAADFEVLLVHRPRYDDWSFPKGKLDEDESFEDAALREVREETGMRCELGDYLGETTYKDRKDREKLVRYWAMKEGSGEFTPGDEVDQVRWVPVEEAGELLTYGFDRELIERVAPGSLG